jgi:hypothetical protein
LHHAVDPAPDMGVSVGLGLELDVSRSPPDRSREHLLGVLQGEGYFSFVPNGGVTAIFFKENDDLSSRGVVGELGDGSEPFPKSSFHTEPGSNREKHLRDRPTCENPFRWRDLCIAAAEVGAASDDKKKCKDPKDPGAGQAVLERD